MANLALLLASVASDTAPRGLHLSNSDAAIHFGTSCSLELKPGPSPYIQSSCPIASPGFPPPPTNPPGTPPPETPPPTQPPASPPLPPPWEELGTGHCQTENGAHHGGFLPDVWWAYHDNVDHTAECKAVCETQTECIGIVSGGPNNYCVLELTSKTMESDVRQASEVTTAAANSVSGLLTGNSYNNPNGGNQADATGEIYKSQGQWETPWWPTATCHRYNRPGRNLCTCTGGVAKRGVDCSLNGAHECISCNWDTHHAEGVACVANNPDLWSYVGLGHCQTENGAHHGGFLPDVWMAFHDNLDHAVKCKGLCESQISNGCVGIVSGGPNNNCVLELSSKSVEATVRAAPEVIALGDLSVSGILSSNAYNNPNSGNQACDSNCAITQSYNSWWPNAECFKIV